MPPTLAEVPSGEFLQQILLLAALGTSIATNVYLMFGRKTPQPLMVELAKEFTPLQRTEKLEERVAKVDEDRRASVGRCYEAMRAEVTQSRREFQEGLGGISKCFQDVMKAVAKIEGKLEERK